MLTAIASWASAVMFCALSKRQRAIVLLPLAFATCSMAVVTIAIVYAPDDYLILGKDRLQYEAMLHDAGVQADPSGDLELGYTLLQFAFSSVSADPGIFFSLVAMIFLIALSWLLGTEYSAAEAIFLLLLTINLFPFAQGAFNVTRQFLAAAVILGGYPIFRRLAHTGFQSVTGIVGFGSVVLLASLFHRSSLMLLLPLSLLMAGVRLEYLLLIGLALFGLNSIGIGQAILEPFVTSDMRAGEIVWQFQRGELADQYTGGTNRIDFFLFSLFPVLSYLWARHGAAIADVNEASLYEYYLCLIFPLFAFSFIPYSERLAFFGWLIWPIPLVSWALRSPAPIARVYVFVATASIAAVALFKLYGTTATTFLIDYAP